MSDVSNLRDTIAVKSDQLTSDELLSGERIIRVTAVSRGNAEQPLVIDYEGGAGKPFKPCKTMRKILAAGWGEDGNAWKGRSMALFNDPEVTYAGIKVGGIRISKMTDIGNGLEVSLTTKKGKKSPFIIKPLVVSAAKPDAKAIAIAAGRAAAELGSAALAEWWAQYEAPDKAKARAALESTYNELVPAALRADEAAANTNTNTETQP